MSLRRTRRPVRVVLFDLDDTLFDHQFAVRRALRDVRQGDPRLARHPLRDLVRESGRILESLHPDVLAGRRSPDDARRERFRRLYRWAGAELGPDELAATAARYRVFYERSVRPVPGAVPLVRRLARTARIGVVSNNVTSEQSEKLHALGIAPMVGFLVTSADVGAAKPDPRIFRHALAVGGVEPEEAAMVGDNWLTDIRGARAAGLRAVWLNRSGLPRPARAPDVPELADLRPASTAARTILGTS